MAKKSTPRLRIFITASVAMIALFFLFANSYRRIWPLDGLSFSIWDLLFALALFSGIFLIDFFFKTELEPMHFWFMAIISTLSLVLIPLYNVYFYYDKILHFVQSLLLSSIIFHMVERTKIKRKWAFVFTIFIIIGIGSIFEIAEFGMDKLQSLQDFSTQGVYLKSLPSHLGKFEMVMDPLTDTDMDMIFNLLGALAYSPVLFLNRRINGKKGTFREMLNERP